MKKQTQFIQQSLLLAGILAFASHQSQAEEQSSSKPNILYILADDLGYNDVGFNGVSEIKTPNLDKLAKEGTVLKSFYAQPLCSASRGALMTGRYPCHNGIYSVLPPGVKHLLPLEERVLPQALKEAGYETAIVGKWHLGDKPDYVPTHRGFDHEYGTWNTCQNYFTHMNNKGNLDWHKDDQPCNDQGYSTHLLAKEACRLIEEKDPKKPLFLYLPFNSVHAPYQVPDSYLTPYANLQGDRKIYAGMVTAMDEAVGQVLAALDAKGIRSNTLILFSSDNGGVQPKVISDNSPLREGKGTIYEGGVRVCSFVNWPGHIPSQASNNEVLHEVDWYPTLIKLAGGSLEQKLPLDGRDIWSVLTQGGKSPHAEDLTICGVNYATLAIRMGDWKLLVWVNDWKYHTRPTELYNLAEDINEEHDLAAKHPEVVQKIMAKYDAIMKTAIKDPNGNFHFKEN